MFAFIMLAGGALSAARAAGIAYAGGDRTGFWLALGGIVVCAVLALVLELLDSRWRR